MHQFENLPHLIRDWANARNLIKGGTAKDQMLKLAEEVGELASGIAKANREEIEDAIGDCFVVLTIIAAQYNLAVEGCVASAYEQIKDRKGKLVDGVFVKEA